MKKDKNKVKNETKTEKKAVGKKAASDKQKTKTDKNETAKKPDHTTVATSTNEKYSADDLVMTSLGGIGEIGMNFYLYGYKGKWLAVDCGIGFAGNDVMPGIEILLPDPSFIEKRNRNLVGMVITHAHEDHIGALPWLWESLKCKIYMTAFAKEMVEERLAEKGLLGRADIEVFNPYDEIDLKPFTVTPIPMEHSIPDACSLLIETDKCRVFHTGDFRFNAETKLNSYATLKDLKKIGDKGILACLCDSTNVFVEKNTDTEETVKKALTEEIKKCREGTIVTCFSSNIVRLRNIAKIALKIGKSVCLVGRSLWRSDSAARNCGYMEDLPEFLSEEEAASLPRKEIIYVCTGSQGEPRSALSQLADHAHRRLELKEGDTVIFSSRVIPGNETSVTALQNRLARLGVRIVTEDNSPVHSSGHASKEDLIALYKAIRPKIAIPMHGESFHLISHAKLAKDCGVKKAVEAKDGDIIKIDAKDPGAVDTAETGILAVDGLRTLRIDSESFRKRRKMMYNGSIVATIITDKKGVLKSDPLVSAIGLFDKGSKEEKHMVQIIRDIIADLKKDDLKDTTKIAEDIRVALRRYVNTIQGSKPITEINFIVI